MGEAATSLTHAPLEADFLKWLEGQPYLVRRSASLLDAKLDELILAGSKIDSWFSPIGTGQGQGLTIISDLFTCLDGQWLFRKNLYRGSFKVLGEDLKRYMMIDIQQSINLNDKVHALEGGEEIKDDYRVVEEDFGSMNAIFITMLNNCNPGMRLGRRWDTTKLRAEYVDGAQTDLIMQIFHLRNELESRGKVAKASLETAGAVVDALHEKYRARSMRAWGNKDYDDAVAHMHELEEMDRKNRVQYKEMTLCMRALQKTPGNRNKKIRL